MSDTGGAQLGGEVILTKLDIISNQGASRFDLFNMFVEINLYEDILSPVVTGTITIVDGFNLISGLPIVGEEIVEIHYVTPGLEDDKYVRRMFYVYKVGVNYKPGDKKQIYTIHLISLEGFSDVNTKVTGAYSGYTSQSAKKIFDKYLKSSTSSPLIVEESTNEIKFVSNFWSPFRCLTYLAAKSQDKSNRNSNFLFFETMKEFKFISLNTLFTDKKVTTLFYDRNPLRVGDDIGKSVRNIDRQFNTVKDLYNDTMLDYLTRAMNGVYGHRVFGIDLTSKKINKHNYSYIDNFAKSKHLDAYPMQSSNIKTNLNNGLISTVQTVPRVHDNIINDNSAIIETQRIPFLAQLEMHKVDAVIPGRSDIQAGQVVEFLIGQNKTIDSTDKFKDLTDPYYGGRYLITAICHRITQTRHEMTLALTKDSFSTEIKFKDML